MLAAQTWCLGYRMSVLLDNKWCHRFIVTKWAWMIYYFTKLSLNIPISYLYGYVCSTDFYIPYLIEKYHYTQYFVKTDLPILYIDPYNFLVQILLGLIILALIGMVIVQTTCVTIILVLLGP